LVVVLAVEIVEAAAVAQVAFFLACREKPAVAVYQLKPKHLLQPVHIQ
jgi:hypothetical protein